MTYWPKLDYKMIKLYKNNELKLDCQMTKRRLCYHILIITNCKIVIRQLYNNIWKKIDHRINCVIEIIQKI